MKARSLIQVMLVGIGLMIQGCNEKESPYNLFTGTLPRMEVPDGSEIRNISPKSLFIIMMDDAIELEGEVYPIERISENEELVTFKSNFPIESELIVTGMIYHKTNKTLILKIGSLGNDISLEPFDQMIERKVNEFAQVDLRADISHLSDNQKELLRILFQVADIMESIYWDQVFSDKDAAMSGMVDDDLVSFFKINYGPWERLNGNLPYLSGYGPKPAGSGYYPSDITGEEFDLLNDPAKTSRYTLVKRNQDGNLEVVPYHLAFAPRVEKAAELLHKAAKLAENAGFEKYLNLRAEALLTDDYLASDMAWMDMKENDIDFVVGPIENYEDALYNYKAAHESLILLKDKAWSEKLTFISSILPELQRSLPVPESFKKEVPGIDSDLGAYDVVYYTGDCNAGSKTIAINLPNDERVQAAKGSRKLQLKNSIRYKFEEILVPVSNLLIAEEQREHVTFDAFFENTMYHEVAHGLGINQTVNHRGTVRSALKEQYSALEEGKADILSLFLITQMYDKGMLGERDLMDNYVTFMASIFRSIRFGVASSHGKANMIRFYYFQELGAFAKQMDGTYQVNFEKMQHAMTTLSSLILITQGNGDYAVAKRLVEEKGYIREELQADLDRLKDLKIPVDIVFNQGPELLGL